MSTSPPKAMKKGFTMEMSQNKRPDKLADGILAICKYFHFDFISLCLFLY